MASQDGPDAAEIVELYGSVFVDNCIALAVVALLLFEYLITFDQEVRLFWKSRARAASALFVVVRYWTLLNYVVLWAFTAPGTHVSDKSCSLRVRAQFATSALQYIPWAALSAMRVLALSGRNWLLAGLVFVLAIGPAVTNLVAFRFGVSAVNMMTAGCQEQVDVTPIQARILSIVARATLIVSDFIVVVVTVHATWQRGEARVLASKFGRTLSDVLLYNGLIYFLVMLCMNTLAVVLGRIADGALAQQGSYITNLSGPLSAIFICRFLLDLQAANRASAELGSQTLSLPTDLEHTIQFEVGAFGASTRHDSLFAEDSHAYWDGAGGRSEEGSEEGSEGTTAVGDAPGSSAVLLRPMPRSVSARETSPSPSLEGHAITYVHDYR